MADNEARALQKMAEGRRKMQVSNFLKYQMINEVFQGGGGFFGRVFGGGGGSAEAPDLFIQVNSSSVAQETGGGSNILRSNNDDEDTEDEEYYVEQSSSEIECSYQGCEFIASNLFEFEQHYTQHSFQCCECGIGFDTSHRLEIHQDERHNPFFEFKVARQANVAHFRCLHPTCEMKFTNSRTRDEHSRIVHFIHGESSRRRKADNDGFATVLSSAMNRMSMTDGETGWAGENQQGLKMNKTRKVKNAVRLRKE